MAGDGRWGGEPGERGRATGRGPLTRPITVATGLAMAGPRLLARGAGPAVGMAAGAVAGTARAGGRTERGHRRAGPACHPKRPAGRRAPLALPRTGALRAPSSGPPERARREGGTEHRTEHLARKVAAALAERPDVAAAYWDGGLARLVVTAAEETLGDEVVEAATELAARHGPTTTDETVEGYAHPGDTTGIRAAAALAADVLGTGIALSGSFLRLPPSPRLVTAVTTLLRENPRFRGLLRDRLGASRMDVLLAVANAAAHGAGQTPIALVLVGTLRTCLLADTVARATAFDTVHDQVCTPARAGLIPRPSARPPLRTTPAQEYAAHASTGSVLGAAAALLVKHDGNEAAEAVLAGSTKAARYGPAAFHAVLSGALARTGVLVRDAERLRQLETADTIVLHSSALRTPGAGADPWAETLLDAARRAGLTVVMVDHPALRDLTGLADQVVDGRRSLREVVEALRDEGATVLTVARPPSTGPEADADHTRVRDNEPLARNGTHAPDGGTDVLDGLLGGDAAVALADGDSAVAWGADVLALNGAADVWRLLTGAVARRSWVWPCCRHSPLVRVTAAIALAVAGQRTLPDLERTVQRLVRARVPAGAGGPEPA